MSGHIEAAASVLQGLGGAAAAVELPELASVYPNG